MPLLVQNHMADGAAWAFLYIFYKNRENGIGKGSCGKDSSGSLYRRKVQPQEPAFPHLTEVPDGRETELGT